MKDLLIQTFHPRHEDISHGTRGLILISQYLILGVIASFTYAVIDFSRSEVIITRMPLIELIVSIGYLGLFLFGRRNKFFVLHFFFIYSTAIITFIAFIEFGNSGVYLYFFPIAVVSYIVHFYENRFFRFLYATISVSIIVALHLYKMKLNEQLTDDFYINSIFSIILIFLAVHFVMRVNKFKEETVQKKNISLEATNKELDRFVYSAAHDLRSPLLSAAGQIGMLEVSSQENKTKEKLSTIKKTLSRLDELIIELIDLARNNRSKVSYHKIDLQAFIEEIVKPFEEDISVSITIDSSLVSKDEFASDGTRLSMILTNLISNATKYRQEQNPKIDIRVENDVDNVKFLIRDNGIGISKDKQPQIFDMFYRGSKDKSGSGLGLYIVKETLSTLDGSINLTSEPQKGSCFTISLPNKISEIEYDATSLSVSSD